MTFYDTQLMMNSADGRGTANRAVTVGWFPTGLTVPTTSDLSPNQIVEDYVDVIHSKNGLHNKVTGPGNLDGAFVFLRRKVSDGR